MRVVKGFGQEARETATLEGRARRLYGERLRAAGLTARLNPMLLALPGLGQVAVIGIGGWMAARGTIDLGTFLAFTTYVGMLVGPARLIGALVVTAQLTRAGAERVFEIVDSAPGIVDPERPASLPEGPLTVELEDVRFGYEPAGSGPDGHAAPDPVLDGLSLRVEPGETLALVGPPGSGKSTVALLLPRFYDPQAGRLAIGGVDLRDLRLHDLRAEPGVVFEEAFLFSDTIRNNIAYGRPDADEDEIRAAAEAAQVASFVEDLPDGYDTEVGERGLTLSGGQRQRIALARAMLTRPRVLVLDDATSAVDTATEAAIHETLHELTAERTTLLVAHRRSTLALADRIAVLDKGRWSTPAPRTSCAAGARCSGSCWPPARRRAGRWHPRGHRRPGRRRARGRHRRGGPRRHGGGVRGRRPGRHPGAVAAGQHRAGPGPRPDPRRRRRRGRLGGRDQRDPELLESVAKLPPATETPRLHGDDDPTAPDPAFRLSSLLRPVRWLLVLGVALMTADALATLALPSIARIAVDDGIADGATRVLLLAALAGLLIVVLDAVVVGFQTLVTAGPGRACSTCCGCAATRTCSGSASTSTSGSCPAGS
ncbi:ATP-binding cassette domain-containing protein [Pseudonocardia sp. ICBG601]|uniref:ATP-binding cassette domain-containing protein n=1 Tax=Pseudonocardia sp. ICBG601 TaxID=2846759 RepID=UPI0035AB6B1F